MRGAGDQHSAEKSPWGNSWWPWKTGQVIFTSLYRGLLFYTCVWALLTPPTFNGIIWDFLSPITKWLWPVPGNTHEGCSPKFWLRIHSDNLEITRSMYMQHSERVCTSSFRQIQGSDCWGHWTCWRVSLATKKSDTGPHPSTHLHNGREHLWKKAWILKDTVEHKMLLRALQNLTVLDGLGLGPDPSEMEMGTAAGFFLMYSTDLLLWNFTYKTWQTSSYPYSF